MSHLSETARKDIHLRAQREVFAQILRGAPLQAALTPLIDSVEKLIDGATGSVLLVNKEKNRFEFGAGPRMPEPYPKGTHLIPIGPNGGSVGTAVHRREPVIVSDIATAPSWEGSRHFALDYGIKAAWGMPILSDGGEAIGAFGLYFGEIREPRDGEIELLRDAAAAAGLVIQQDRNRGSLERAISLSDATIESTADGILVVDTEGVIRKFNRRFAEMWSIPREILESGDDRRAIAFVLDQLKHPEAMEASTRELYANPEQERFDLVEFKDGRIFERYSRPQWLGGKVVGRVWSFRDETSRYKALRALRESEARFRKLAESSFEGLAIHENGVILLANESMTRMFGYEPAELIGMSLARLAPPDAIGEILRRVQSGIEGPYETRGLRKDGTVFWGEINGRNTTFEGRAVRMSSMRDITDRKLLQEQLERNLEREQQARVDAENSARLRDDFLAIASHELKTPLTPLKMYLQILREYVGEMNLPDSPKTRLLQDALEHTDREYDRLHRLINELLDVSMITSGRMTLNRERCDLSALVRDTAGRFAREFDRSGCALALDVADGIEGNWDRSRIERVLTNLITNALKFGSGRPVGISALVAGGQARIRVRDQGIGVPKEEQGRIFERFARAASIRNYAGLGLGLYIAREIVIAHGGAITVESEPGLGATFEVALPL